MKYNFKFKSKFDRKSWKENANNLASKFLFLIYDNILFKKLKLDRNIQLKSMTASGLKSSLFKPKDSKIPNEPNLNIHSITLLDCIENEDAVQIRNLLTKVVSKYNDRYPSEEPSVIIKKAFEKFDSEYKTTSWGRIYYNNLKDNEEIDLIDGVSYNYVKGAQSHFVLYYTLYPSEKFKSLFKESLKAETTEKFVIIFNSLKQIVKTKRLFSAIKHKVKKDGFWTDKLLKEINFQAKTRLIKGVKLGFFNKHIDLFPTIITFEHDSSEFNTYCEELLNVLNVNPQDHYRYSDIIFTLNNSDYSKSFLNSIEIFIPFKSYEEKKDPFNDVSFLSSFYICAIAPYWLLINVSSFNKQKIIEHRKKTFLYIRKNRVSIFLKKVIKLKNDLSLDWINFERIRKDFSAEIFKHQLKSLGIPDAHNTPIINGANTEEFKEALISYAAHTSMDIKKSYDEILELYKYIGEDNTTRANMRLQRLLVFIAIIGILLAIYGANSNWFNSWIKFYLNNWDIKIPKAPTE